MLRYYGMPKQTNGWLSMVDSTPKVKKMNILKELSR